jgi:hypothetical protein
MKFIILPLILLWSEIGYSELQQRQINLREACRRTVAGYFLKHHDMHVQSQNYEMLIKDKLTKLNTASKKYNAEYEVLRKKTNKDEFSMELAEKRDNAYAKVKNARISIVEYEEMIKKAHADRENAESKINSLKSNIKSVFALKKAKETLGAYPYKVDYISPCPKYHHLCPLPHKYASSLKVLKIEGETPEVCGRYANFSNLLNKG